MAVTCDEVEELAGALALGAALPEEVAAVREHLTTCPTGHPALARLIATAALLAEAAEPVEPPPRLRERILAAARADPGAPVGVGTGAAAAGTAVPTAAIAAGAPGDVPEEAGATPALPPRPAAAPARPADRVVLRPGRAWPAWLAAAAVLVLAAGLGVWNISLRRELRDRERELAADRASLAALAGGGEIVAFTVSPQLAGARGALLRPAQGLPVVVFSGLSRPPEGWVYQLWAMHADYVRDLGTFLPTDDGRAIITLSDLAGAGAVAVTLEQGRVAQPTGAPVLIAPLTGFQRPLDGPSVDAPVPFLAAGA
jgi:hypothetical protein